MKQSNHICRISDIGLMSDLSTPELFIQLIVPIFVLLFVTIQLRVFRYVFNTAFLACMVSLVMWKDNLMHAILSKNLQKAV